MSNINSFHAIDLSQLPAPQIIEQLSYETLFAERKAQLNALQPLLFDEQHQPVLLTAELIQTEAEIFWKVPLNAQAFLNHLCGG